MGEMVEVFCRNTNSKILIPFGTTLAMAAKFAGIKSEFPILGAYVNNKVQNLNYPIFIPKTVEFFDVRSSVGRRMYAMSLMFVMYKAVKELYAKTELYINHSMSSGYYTEIDFNKNETIEEITDEVVCDIKNKMIDIINEDISFSRKIISASDASELYERIGISEKAEQIKNIKRLYVNIDYLGDTVESFYNELVPSTSYLNVFNLEKFEQGILLVMPDKNNPRIPYKQIKKQKKIFSVFKEHKTWAKILETSYVSDLNRIVDSNKHNEIIQVAEALHEKRYADIADQIYKRKDEVKIVLLAGPSSSGKTTSCRRLATQLAVLGFKPVQISLDDYFVDREFTPKDKDGNYDFECLEALDIELFNDQMTKLLNGEEVSIPRFDFTVGKKFFNGNKLKMEENSIMIIEGIHGLNPKLTKSIEDKNKYKVFVSAMTQVSLDRHNLISSSDNRLIRRIVRDHNYRNYSATETINRWQSVRNGEEKHIFPFQENADSIFNSSLLYEMGVLKIFAEPLLHEVPQTDVAYAEAKRLISFLSHFEQISTEMIPPTSIMREFLGGSSFEY